MAIAKKCLKKQQRFYYNYMLRGVMLTGIGIFAGIMILKNGIGKEPDSRSAGAIIYQGLSWAMDQGEQAKKLVPICFAGFFFVLAAIGISLLFRGIWGAVPSHTPFGKSVLIQTKSYEKLPEMILTIDADFEREVRTYESVSIGREWVLCEGVVMRISRLQGIFTIKRKKSELLLCLVDQERNTLCTPFYSEDHLTSAANTLQDMQMDAVSGDYTAYMSFLESPTLEANAS